MDELEESDDEFAKSDDQTEVNHMLRREGEPNGANGSNGKRLFLDDEEEENSILDDDDEGYKQTHNGFKSINKLLLQ